MLCYDKKPLSICHIRCGGIGTGLRSNCSACETGSNNHNTEKVCPRDQIGQGFPIKAYEIFAKISGSNFRRVLNNVRGLEYDFCSNLGNWGPVKDPKVHIRDLYN